MTLNTDSYAPFGQLPQLPDRPEDPSKWKVVKLTDADLLKRGPFKTKAQLATARAHLGYPNGTQTTIIKFGSYPTDRRETLLKDVESWDEAARSAGLLK
jgi:hypothetical protein